MKSIIDAVENQYRKKQVVEVRSGDTVRVSQRIKEGNKERTQVFEGLVIRTRRPSSLTATITVRRIASGVGVEKTFMLHSPLVEKVEVTKRSKVRRKYLSYMRDRSGKSARLDNVNFDKDAVNKPNVPVDDSKAAQEAEEALAATEEPKEEAKPEVAAEAPKEEKPAEEAKTEDKPEAKEEAEEPKKQTKEEKAAEKKAKAKEFQEKNEGK